MTGLWTLPCGWPRVCVLSCGHHSRWHRRAVWLVSRVLCGARETSPRARVCQETAPLTRAPAHGTPHTRAAIIHVETHQLGLHWRRRRRDTVHPALAARSPTGERVVVVPRPACRSLVPLAVRVQVALVAWHEPCSVGVDPLDVDGPARTSTTLGHAAARRRRGAWSLVVHRGQSTTEFELLRARRRRQYLAAGLPGTEKQTGHRCSLRSRGCRLGKRCTVIEVPVMPEFLRDRRERTIEFSLC